MKFSVPDFFSNCEQIRRKLQICLPLLKKSVKESFIFCAVKLWQRHVTKISGICPSKLHGGKIFPSPYEI